MIQDKYLIPGGKETIINLNTGDKVDVVNTEGDQPCLMVLINEKLQPDISVVEFTKDIEVLKAKDLDNPQLNKIISQHKLTANAQVVNLFKTNSQANSTVCFQVTNKASCILLALGKQMKISEQNSPTNLNVLVSNSQSKKPNLPKPLATPKKDINIKNSSAESYLVKAGEYIQIIDVEGHQCSDFQAFAQSDINNNQDLCIDPTVTRTTLCITIPMPGLLNKLYNQNNDALLEIVHDKVARHDSFLLACNAKYYEDRGYLGHKNCTENINQALAPHGVKPRKNWVTFNLFFNTDIADCSSVMSDVSWSQPGEYVLFKALKDLVCVSSACPDDTTCANNWQPSDVHVRIYDKKETFKPAIVFKPTPEAIPMLTQETGFHAQTSKHTNNFVEYNGYWLAQEYSQYGTIKEYWACRESVVMMDLSPLCKFEIYGEDAENLMQLALTRDIRKLAVGQVVYTGICYENGCMIDDGTIFRLCQNNFRWICGNNYSGKWLRQLAEKHNMEVWVKTSTDQQHNVAVQGPKSRDVLKKIIWTKDPQPNIEDLKWFKFTIGRINNETGTPVIVSRTGYTGELGFEVFCHPKDATEVWQAIWDAGAEYNITPLGLGALDMLRIESGLIFAGYEFNDQTDPFESGIGFTVPLKSKQEDFIGKESLQKRKQSPERTLVGLELVESEVANHGDGVYLGKQQIGVITSGTRSPILNKNIALCRISIEYSKIDTKVEVGKLDGQQKRLAATVVNFPFYDPDKSRVRM